MKQDRRQSPDIEVHCFKQQRQMSDSGMVYFIEYGWTTIDKNEARVITQKYKRYGDDFLPMHF